jgi:hypothetical protein
VPRHLDLQQAHNLARMEQVERIFGPGGAMEALREAREQRRTSRWRGA